MGEAMSKMQEELRDNNRGMITPVFSSSSQSSSQSTDDLYGIAIAKAFRICDGVLGNPESITLIEFPANLDFDSFMQLVEELYGESS